MTQKLYFISYGSKQYSIQKKRIGHQAKKFKIFNDVILYSQNSLDSRFLNKFSNLFNDDIGGGYWIWKSHIVLKTFNLMKEGDILLYVDSGSTLNVNGKKRLLDYIDKLNSSEKSILCFQMNNYVEKEWTTKQVFEALNANNKPHITNTSQVMGGVFLVKKSNESIKFFQDFQAYVYSDINLITNYYQELQDTKFKSCRHDQSLFSVMCKLTNQLIIEDETFFLDKPNLQYDFPILTVRDGPYSLWQKIKFYVFYPYNIQREIYFGNRQFYYKRKSKLQQKIMYKLKKLRELIRKF